MKYLFLIVLCLFHVEAFAKAMIEVDVINAEYFIEDDENNKTLCLTVVRVPLNGDLIGIVESLTDCYYARLANSNPGLPLKIDLSLLSPIEHSNLMRHLQKMDSQLRFYFSEGE
jgi:hypothetical protein